MAPSEMTWNQTLTVAAKSLPALPLADAGRSWETWPRSGSRWMSPRADHPYVILLMTLKRLMTVVLRSMQLANAAPNFGTCGVRAGEAVPAVSSAAAARTVAAAAQRRDLRIM